MDKEKKRRIAYEVMIFLGVFALFLFITRLWPILLLVIIGIFICALRLLFTSAKKIAAVEPAATMPPLPILPAPETEQSIIHKAFGLLQQRITEQVLAAYPAARWVWSNPKAQDDFAAGYPLVILLNSAGGYQKARVLVSNLMFAGIAYEGVELEHETPESTPQTESEPEASDQTEPDAESEDDFGDEPPAVNYERLAFEWVETHLMELGARCNEAIANGQAGLLLPAHELPHPDSWIDVCTELKRNGFPDADIMEDAINLTLPQ